MLSGKTGNRGTRKSRRHPSARARCGTRFGRMPLARSCLRGGREARLSECATRTTRRRSSLLDEIAEIAERLFIDRAVVAHAIFEILAMHELDERLRARPGDEGIDLFVQVRINGQNVLRLRLEEIELVQFEDARELFDRIRMIVDAQVDVAIVEARVTAAWLRDIQRGALLPAPVAAGGLSGTQRRDESIGEVPSRLLERPREAIDDAFA